MEITLPLEKMTVAEKLRVMETLWSDLTRHGTRFESPAWHGSVLRERAKRVKQGKESFIDWQTAKKQLRGRGEMSILILPSARDDLSDGFEFYEGQQEGLGDYFLESLSSDIESLQLYAGIHPKQFGLHRLLSKRFPFAIYYDKKLKTTQIWAVLDCRRDPKAIREKLTGFR